MRKYSVGGGVNKFVLHYAYLFSHVIFFNPGF